MSHLKPRVLILDRFYFPDEQATSIYLTELTEGLADQFDFEMICGSPLVVTEKPASSPRCRIHQVPALKFPKDFLFSRALNDLSFLFSAFIRGIFLPSPDLFVSQTSPPCIWWVAFLLSRWHRRKWVHISQDVFPENLRELMNGKCPSVLGGVERLNRLILRKAGRIVVIGDDMKQGFLNRGFSPDKVTRIFNWVDTKLTRPLPQKNPFTGSKGLADKFVVLYAGNLGRIYNLEDLMGAAEQLRNYPEIQFVFVGSGALKKNLIHQVRSRGLAHIKFLPFEPRSKLAEVLASASVSIILLRKGMAGLSVPSKIYSILASGRPVLACVEETSDIARIVRESQAGLVIPPGNPQALARAIEELFHEREKAREMGLKARRYIETMDFKRHALQGYAQLFKEVLTLGCLENE